MDETESSTGRILHSLCVPDRSSSRPDRRMESIRRSVSPTDPSASQTDHSVAKNDRSVCQNDRSIPLKDRSVCRIHLGISQLRKLPTTNDSARPLPT